MEIIEDSSMDSSLFTLKNLPLLKPQHGDLHDTYNGFIINNCENIKENIKKNINDLYKKINIKFNLFIDCNINKFTLTESITILEYLLDNKKKIKSNVADIIYIFEQILRTFLEKCALEEIPRYKASINNELCEFLIKYNFLFEHSLFKKRLDIIKNYFINRCLQLSIKEGCILGWLVFATFYPKMINNNCYLQINTSGIIYKYINWNYIKTNSLLQNKLELYFKYYPEYIYKSIQDDTIVNIKTSYI